MCNAVCAAGISTLSFLTSQIIARAYTDVFLDSPDSYPTTFRDPYACFHRWGVRHCGVGADGGGRRNTVDGRGESENVYLRARVSLARFVSNAGGYSAALQRTLCSRPAGNPDLRLMRQRRKR
ncbi:hypothetical protein B0H16DRAFT_549071 [Mycena metata]|uniref:Uncharacterized protein n=1 Tax=Mycena metata TaxID=1033252 RepID=A0AAD7ME23_9AGAR|nr:hypothetical protein B0H16DRAFT_549071 [Mycena metata]